MGESERGRDRSARLPMKVIIVVEWEIGSINHRLSGTPRRRISSSCSAPTQSEIVITMYRKITAE